MGSGRKLENLEETHLDTGITRTETQQTITHAQDQTEDPGAMRWQCYTVHSACLSDCITIKSSHDRRRQMSVVVVSEANKLTTECIITYCITLTQKHRKKVQSSTHKVL